MVSGVPESVVLPKYWPRNWPLGQVVGCGAGGGTGAGAGVGRRRRGGGRPLDCRDRVAAVLVVLELYVVVARGQPADDGIAGRDWSFQTSRTLVPSTHGAHAVVPVTVKVVSPAGKPNCRLQRAEKCPRDGRAGARRAPVVVQGRRAAGLERRAGEGRVAEVLAAELAGRAGDRRRRGRRGRRRGGGVRRYPLDARDRSIQVLVVLELDLVVAGGELALDGVRRRGLVAPGVEQNGSVDPDARAVVCGDGEGRVTGGEVELADPARREVVCGNGRARAPLRPVVVDGGRAGRPSTRAREGRVAEVLSAELTRRTDGRGRGRRRGRRCGRSRLGCRRRVGDGVGAGSEPGAGAGVRRGGRRPLDARDGASRLS